MSTLLLDNYDSFTYNLYQYLGELGAKPIIYKNNKITLKEIIKLSPQRIVISPGPGTPEDPTYFGVCLDAILKLGKTIPLLGVCLGHQGIIYAFGGKIIRAKKIMHGKTSMIEHTGKDIFKHIKNPFQAMRYHSLVGSLTHFPHKELEITASVQGEKVVMAVKHKKYPIYGIQFHPESIGTPEGKAILKNFIQLKASNIKA